MEKLLSKPIFFKENRVYRVYLGGKGIALFNGSKMSEDDFFPEEWIASKVKAINPKYFGERDGVSVVEGTKSFSTTFWKNTLIFCLGTENTIAW